MRARAVSFKFQQREWLLENLRDKIGVIAAKSEKWPDHFCRGEISCENSWAKVRKVIDQRRNQKGEGWILKFGSFWNQIFSWEWHNIYKYYDVIKFWIDVD